jgi:hypothetical protein
MFCTNPSGGCVLPSKHGFCSPSIPHLLVLNIHSIYLQQNIHIRTFRRTIISTGTHYWARICKRLWNPEIGSDGSIPPSYVACRAGTTNRVVVQARHAGNRFLGSLKGLQIRALYTHTVLTCITSCQGVTKRCRLSWLTYSITPSYMSPNAGGGVAGSQPMSTAVLMEPK